MSKYFAVNEIFVSPQGEGVRSGTLNHFIRFSGCNLQCTVEPGPLSPGGFDCDSEFLSFRKMTADDMLAEMQTLNPRCKSIIFTGGEPGLQITKELVDFFRPHGYYMAAETNGSIDLAPLGLDWITCSPKVAEHAVRLKHASEVKYVRGYGQGIPRPTCQAEHKLISPAFNGMSPDPRAVSWCLQLLNENPDWRLSVQSHKFLAIR